MSKKKKKGFEPPEKKNAVVGDINVTPLIDIVLVLLIIYPLGSITAESPEYSMLLASVPILFTAIT